MTELLILTNEHLRCEIKPALGGCVAGLWFQGIPVLRSTPAQSLVSVRESGSFPLVPFSNRIGHATLQWNGTRGKLPDSRTDTSDCAGVERSTGMP